jgi:hypothetical protein
VAWKYQGGKLDPIGSRGNGLAEEAPVYRLREFLDTLPEVSEFVAFPVVDGG